MNTGLVLRGLSVIGAFALVATLTVTAVAQPTQPRVVQSSDGTLYLVQGGSAWPLLPDQISDDDLAALNLGGEVDGIIPPSLLNLAAPEPPPSDPAPATDAAPPAPAPETVAVPTAPAPTLSVAAGQRKRSPASSATGTPTSATTAPAPTSAPLKR